MIWSLSGEQYSSQQNLMESGLNITKRKRNTDLRIDLCNTEMFNVIIKH